MLQSLTRVSGHSAAAEGEAQEILNNASIPHAGLRPFSLTSARSKPVATESFNPSRGSQAIQPLKQDILQSVFKCFNPSRGSQAIQPDSYLLYVAHTV